MSISYSSFSLSLLRKQWNRTTVWYFVNLNEAVKHIHEFGIFKPFPESLKEKKGDEIIEFFIDFAIFVSFVQFSHFQCFNAASMKLDFVA